MTAQKDNEHQVAGRLFGATVKLPATGSHRPAPEELEELARVPNPEIGDANVYCAGCGTIIRILQEGADALAKKASTAVPSDWEGKYFLVQGCLACADEFKQPELKIT